MAETQSRPRLMRFGAFEADLQTGELRKDGVKLKFSGQPFQVLVILLERPGDVVTREELQKRLWPDTFVDVERNLNTAVNKIREVLGDSAESPRFVETLPRRGYRFIAPLDGVGASDEAFVVAPPGLVERTIMGRGGRTWWVGAAMALCVAGLLGWGWRHWTRRPIAAYAPVIRSLAVLPLENLSGDPSQEYFADGMTDELTTDLAQIGLIRVISRTSMMHYKGTRKPLPQIAQELGVDGIVEGTVLRSGDRVRIASQLIYAPLDQHLWAHSYEREVSDVLTLQGEIAHAIAGAIRVAVAPDQGARLANSRPVDPAVYENYLRGRFALSQNTQESLKGSMRYFEEAIRKDPSFAPAYAGLAGANLAISTVLIGTSPSDARQKALSTAMKALELDPQLAEAHVLVAEVRCAQWQWAQAEFEYRRALELNPSNAAAHIGLATWMISHGRTEEALASARRATELDPRTYAGTDIGWILFMGRRYDEAVRELRTTLTVKPDEPFALWFLGFALLGQRNPQDAIAPLERAMSLTHGSPGVTGVLVRAYAEAGRRPEAIRLLNELKRREQTSYVPPAAFLNAYLGLGDREQAFVWLDRAYKEQSNMLQWLKVHPFFDPLRDDPRFAELLRRVGLTD